MCAASMEAEHSNKQVSTLHVFGNAVVLILCLIRNWTTTWRDISTKIVISAKCRLFKFTNSYLVLTFYKIQFVLQTHNSVRFANCN